ncbi:MAG: hypothetical protein CNLJKLNK_00178 [Holosporales bacterium]
MARKKSRYSYYPEYVRVADRKENNLKMIKKMQKKGDVLNPIMVEGKVISTTFWGKAWCKHIEEFSDYDNRLGRGRSYLRTGCVLDFKVDDGQIKAKVSGSSIYQVVVQFSPLSKEKWNAIVKTCSGKIDSVLSLLQGLFSKDVMTQMTDTEMGLFPKEKEIELTCDCLDGAYMCKHIAAVLYAFGHWLDSNPEDLFKLRSVDHMDLLKADVLDDFITQTRPTELEEDLGALFGIDLAPAPKARKKETLKKTKK